MEVINLNLIPSGANPVAHAAQFDVGRVTRFNLLEGATPYTLDGTETITASVRKNDGHIVTEAVTNTSDSYLEVITTEQMTACAGENLATIKIKKGSDTIATLNYILMVQKDPEDGGDPSESFIHDLSQQIADAVSEQYAAEDVVFDNAPTAGHGVGFAVTSEGILAAIPDEISDLSDVSITSPQAGEILIWNGAEWENQANPASTANFAPDYDSAATYDKNEKVIYQGLLYIANDDGITGAWDPTKWDPFTVGDLTAETLPLGANDPTTTSEAIGDLSQLTTTVKSSLVGAVNEVDGNKPTNTAGSPFLKVKTTENISKSINANGYASILGSDINLAEAGYTPIGIVSMYNTQSAGCFFGSFDCSVVSGGSTFAIVKNTSTSNINATMNFKILFMRTTN